MTTIDNTDKIDLLVARYRLHASEDEQDAFALEGGLPRPHTFFVDSGWFNTIVVCVIGVNVVTVGLETDARSSGGGGGAQWFILELVYCVFYCIELGLRIYYHRSEYFTKPAMRLWNIFDLVIVILAVFETLILVAVGFGWVLKFVVSLRFWRIVRLVRLLRLFKIFKELWLVTSGIIDSLKTLFWISLTLFVLCYVFGIWLTIAVGQDDSSFDRYFRSSNGWDHEVYFKTVVRSVFTLFQVLTLDSWNEITRHVAQEHQYMTIVFFIFVVVGSFGVLNIIVGVVVENTLSTSERDKTNMRKKQENDRHMVFTQLREIFEAADVDKSGTLTIDEVVHALDKPEVDSKLRMIDFPVENPQQLFKDLDYDNTKDLTIDEFITGCMRMKGIAKSKDLLEAQVALDTMRKHYRAFEVEMQKFHEKLHSLEHTAKELITHGEHVFLNAQEYRLRHPTMRESQPMLSYEQLDAAPWEKTKKSKVQRKCVPALRDARDDVEETTLMLPKSRPLEVTEYDSSKDVQDHSPQRLHNSDLPPGAIEDIQAEENVQFPALTDIQAKGNELALCKA
eukprot:TRINITY_DN36185_c0_g1_i1.p1 TRINITY_DN36185_c0_g1~~TRINITY_DN36185_c0_g1_i1.p1  ORF type:complete len:564 (+),score=88.45 TRINITY_DN36185_c0_g1_i1:81-1772(+)